MFRVTRPKSFLVKKHGAFFWFRVASKETEGPTKRGTGPTLGPRLLAGALCSLLGY